MRLCGGARSATRAWFMAPTLPPHDAPAVTTAPPPEENVTLRTNDNPQEVFQRAFWRRPTADDRILHAERREWVSEEDCVRRWQWFLAVEPGAALDQWLRKENPFGLAKVTSAAPFDGFAQSPSWFPTEGELTRCEIHRAAGNRMTLIFEPAKKVLYATDAGHGFAIAWKQIVSFPRPSGTPRLRNIAPALQRVAEEGGGNYDRKTEPAAVHSESESQRHEREGRRVCFQRPPDVPFAVDFFQLLRNGSVTPGKHIRQIGDCFARIPRVDTLRAAAPHTCSGRKTQWVVKC